MDLNFLKKAFQENNFILSDRQVKQFQLYYELLIEKNKVMNLTSIVEWKDVVIKHFVDSIAIGNFMKLRNQSIVDIGTGAGFPGIPIKIMYPETKILLIDSLNKRVKFLNDVIENLDLKEIKAIHGRAEEVGKNNDYRENHDICVSRAVANLRVLSEYCIPLVKQNGYFIAYKSGNIVEEEKESKGAIDKLGGKIEKTDTFIIEGSDISRSFVFIKKSRKTPRIYPRLAGKPLKEPLS